MTGPGGHVEMSRQGLADGAAVPLGVAHLVLEEISRQMGAPLPSAPLACMHTVSLLAQTLFLFELGPCLSS